MDGIGVSIIKRRPGTKKGAGQKRERGVKSKEKHERLLKGIEAWTGDRFKEYDDQDVVFADPNTWDLLDRVHPRPTKEQKGTLRNTSM